LVQKAKTNMNQKLSKYMVNWHWPRWGVPLNNLHSEFHCRTYMV
jgi:hypothetical protein